MFKKIVSNLPYSPALIGQLAFYAKRLRKEETTRRLGLFFVILALIVQSLAVFQPPEAANAASASDMVYGGLSTSLDSYLKPYDSNTKFLKDTMNYIGITREEIVASKYSSWTAKDKISWGFISKYSYDQGERVYSVTNASGQIVTTVYSRPMTIKNSPDTEIFGWIGYSKKVGWFGIMKNCGNLVTNAAPKVVPPPTPTTTVPDKCALNPALLSTDKDCKPCLGNETIWINDPSCKPNIIKSKTATNTSKNFIDASSEIADAGDQISYTINIENTGLESTTVKLEDNIADILEYSTLTNNGGGSLDKNTGILSWSDVTLIPKAKQTRTFVVKLLDPIPVSAQGISDDTSFDCNMTNVFGNSINIKVNCPTAKVVEQVVTRLPVTGPNENIVFIGIVLAFTSYFYARTRQVKKELRLIRRDASSGII
ncbi:MAG: hypothetical protein WCQ49_02460 [Candidatus Saccharibacteria bacterium]